MCRPSRSGLKSGFWRGVAALARGGCRPARVRRSALFLATLASLACGAFVAVVDSASPLDRVVVQLKWWHQYQFAGYYAASLKGYYRDEGLDVELVEGSPARPSLKMVLDGQADFAISDTEVLLARMSGRPVVAIATIFQHSPYVLMTRRDSGITRPTDLVGKRVMLAGDRNEAQFFAMLRREGIKRESLTVVRHSWRVDDLLERRVDAMSAYSTVEAAEMRARGVEPGMIQASDYGVDFYGDTLFTSEAVIARDPERVIAFRRASIRGWEYALDHVDELARYIQTLPTGAPQRPTYERLLAEAGEMRHLVLPDVVEIGRINPGRFERMAQTFQELGLHSGPYTLAGFVFDPDTPREQRWRRYALIGLASAVSLALAGFVSIRELRRAVRRRTAELAAEVVERRVAEAELRASEERFRHIVEHMPALLDAVDGDGHFVFWNGECERVTGYSAEEIVGNPDAMAWLYPDEAQRTHVIGLRGKTGPEGVELALRDRDGRERRVLWRSLSDQVQIPGWAHWSIGVDVTATRELEAERGRYEERLREAQRLESLGLLAGGIAHDFNNLLTGMQGHAELALADLEGRPLAAENVTLIERAARRAADLTRQLLAYSGRGRFVVEPLDLSHTVRDMAQLLELTVSHRARLTIDTSRDLPAVDADATQVRQVLMNLILNAAESMGTGQGQIRVSTRLVEVDATLASQNVAGNVVAEGAYVAIAVRDTGAGMSDEVRARIFEPFFSTKFHGRGLGLAAVIGIVRSHNGALLVDTAPGAGACFTVLLPRSTRTAPAPEVRSRVQDAWRGSGSVLVVDDEPAVRDLAQRMLTRMGFDVVLANDGVDGLAHLEQRGGGFTWVMLDLTMPRMSGDELLQAVRERGWKVPVVLASGYHEHDVTARREALAPVTFLHKPFTYRQLQATIRALLEAVGEPAHAQSISAPRADHDVPPAA